MLFENVTDITIPQGNVIKIHEAVSGRVLWEKEKFDIDILEYVNCFYKHNNDYVYSIQLFLEFEDNHYTATYPHYRKVQVGDVITLYYVPYVRKGFLSILSNEDKIQIQNSKQLMPETTQLQNQITVIPATVENGGGNSLYFDNNDIAHHLVTLSNYTGNTVSVVSLDYNNILADIENLSVIKNEYPKAEYPYFGVRENINIYCKVHYGVFIGSTKFLGQISASRAIKR